MELRADDVRVAVACNSKSGAEGFGREYPALLVSDAQGQRPRDVFPHENSAGQVTTIRSFVDSILAVAATKIGDSTSMRLPGSQVRGL
jgi:hypothetical protein